MSHLANEILVMIFRNLCSHCSGPHFPWHPVSTTLYSLSLVSRRFNQVAELFLYHSFSSQNSDHDPEEYVDEIPKSVAKPKAAAAFLRTILRRPELAAQVRLLDFTVTVGCTQDDFFGGKFDKFGDIQDNDRQSVYALLLRLIYLGCTELETITFRKVYSLEIIDDLTLTAKKIGSGMLGGVEKLLTAPLNDRSPLRNCNFLVDLHGNDLDEPAAKVFQGLQRLTIGRTGYFSHDDFPSVIPRGLQELNLLNLCSLDCYYLMDWGYIQRFNNLRAFRMRIIEGNNGDAVYRTTVGDVINALHHSKDTLEYFEFSANHGSPETEEEDKDMSEFTALKTVKIDSYHLWGPNYELALAIDKSRPDSTWLEKDPESMPHEIWDSVRWLPPNMTRLDIANVSPCEIGFMRCIAAGKAHSYPDLIDLRVSTSSGCYNCEDGIWNPYDDDGGLTTRCNREETNEELFQSLKGDEIFAVAGIQVWRLRSRHYWNDVYSCEEVDP